VSSGIDKRRHHRFLARLAVEVVPGPQVPKDLTLATVDVGVGGIRCAGNMRLEPNTRLQLTITLVGGELPQPAPIGAEAIVLRCDENPAAPANRRHEVALQFVRLDPRDRKVLQAYLNSL